MYTIGQNENTKDKKTTKYEYHHVRIVTTMSYLPPVKVAWCSLGDKVVRLETEKNKTKTKTKIVPWFLDKRL